MRVKLTRINHAWGKAHARGRSWVGLIHACGAAATCVWSAYGLSPSHFDCLHREWSDLTRMVHARGKAHALLAGGCTVWPAWSIRWVALASW